MTPSSRAEQIVKSSARRAVNSETRERQRNAELALLYLEDYDEMVRDLEQSYKHMHANPEKWTKRPKVCFKIVEPIVDALCGLYRECPAYTFKEKDKSWADEFAAWKDEHWSTMSDVDRFTLVSGVTACRPMVEQGQPLEIALYTGDQLDYDPKPSKPVKLGRLILSFRTSLEEDMGLVEQLWSDTTYERLVNAEPKYSAAEQLAYPGGVHKYGRIPFVLFHNGKPRWTLMGEPITDLVAINRAVNRQMSDHHYRMILSGSILYTKGDLLEDQIKVGPDAHIKLSKDGEAGFIEADAQVAAQVESINLYLRMFLLSRRIPESAVAATQSGDSGIKIVAEQAALNDYRKDRASLFGPWERELIRMELFVNAIHSGKRVRWEDVPAPSIAYQLPQEPMSLEQRTDWDRAIRIGLATAVDEMIARNPSMDRPAALKKVEDNIAETMRLQGLRPMPAFKPGQKKTPEQIAAEEAAANG